MSYYILPRPDALDKHFAINNVTGSIRIVNPFQPDQISSALGGKLELAVAAYDHGLPSLTSTASVTAFFQVSRGLSFQSYPLETIVLSDIMCYFSIAKL